MRSYSLSFILLSVLTLGFIANREFPNGLFSLKLLAGYFIAILSILVVLISSIRYIGNWNKLINPLNLSVFLLLVLIPICHYFLSDIKLSSLASSLSTYVVFFSIGYLGGGLHWLLLIKKFYFLVFTALILQCVICLFQFMGFFIPYHHISKISGMFFNPGPFSIYFVSLLLFIVPLSFIAIKKKLLLTGIFTLAIILGCILILLELKSRSAWIGFSAGVLIIISIFILNYEKNFLEYIKKRKIIILSIALVLLFAIGNLAYQIRPESANGRVLIWKSTLTMISENLWTGIGTGNFAVSYPIYQGKVLQIPSMEYNFGKLAGQTEYAFNDLLHIFSETGLFGAILYLFVIAYSIFRLIKFIMLKGYTNERFVVGSSFAAVLVAFTLSGMTSYPMQMIPINMWFWTIIAIINVICTRNTSKTQSKSYMKGIFNFMLFSLLCCFLIFNFKNIRGYLLWSSVNNGDSQIEALLPYLWYMDGEGELFLHFAQYAFKTEQYTEAIYYFRKATMCQFDKEYYYGIGQSYEKQHRYTEALMTYKNMENALPNLVKPRYLKAKLLYNTGQFSEFENTAKELLLLVPKVQNTSTELMIKEIRFLLRKSITLTNTIL